MLSVNGEASMPKEVLEEAQNGQVDDDADHQPSLAHRLIRRCVHEPRHPVVDERRQHQQAQEPVVPHAVEEVARDEQHPVLPLQPPLQQQVQAVHDHQEHCELQAVEQHGGSVRSIEQLPIRVEQAPGACTP
jgi:hypothetical protein